MAQPTNITELVYRRITCWPVRCLDAGVSGSALPARYGVKRNNRMPSYVIIPRSSVGLPTRSPA